MKQNVHEIAQDFQKITFLFIYFTRSTIKTITELCHAASVIFNGICLQTKFISVDSSQFGRVLCLVPLFFFSKFPDDFNR